MCHNITFADFFEKCNILKIADLHNSSSFSVEDFYENVVLKNEPKKEIVIKWHELLIKYVNDDDAIFFVRRYASAPNKDWTKIRRGFLTEYDCGLKYVFCDNYFAHYFFMMVIKGIVPTYEEFKSLILEREFPYGYMVTSQEKPLQAFKRGKAVNINFSGWKLDHINSVNKDYIFDYNSQKEVIFPRGEQEEWIVNNGNNYCSRKMESSVVENHKEKVIAHFLRLVHPMNYFLTPQKKNCSFDVGGHNKMIDFVREKNKVKYGILFDDFEKMALVKDNTTVSKPFPAIITFGFNHIIKNNISRKEKKNNIAQTKSDYSKNIELDIKIIKSYLVDRKSFRTIEKEIMNIDSKKRGGGFKARSILASLVY